VTKMSGSKSVATKWRRLNGSD